jgi:uncharacterized protein
MIPCGHPVYCVLVAALLLGLSACGSSPAVRFYTLAPLQSVEIPAAVEVAERRGILAVGPVELANHLDRPQIVRRVGTTSVSLLENDRWAGSLQSDLARVLIDNLGVLLGPEGYVVLPWEVTARADGRIQVSVTRLERTDQQTVVLDALWTLHGMERGDILAAGREVIAEPDSGGAEGTVEAMSRALAELSRRIAVAAEAGLGLAE